VHAQLAQHLRSLQPKGDPPRLPPGERGGIFGRLVVSRENGVLENKSGNRPISETRRDGVKVITMGAYRNSPTLFRTVDLPSPTPDGLPFLQMGVCNLN